MSSLPVALVTITKDQPASLTRTLTSAARLREAGAEHVVVDGGVPAVEGNILVGSREHGVRIVRHPPAGIADAFNVGLAETRSDWVWFLNGGDCVDPRLSAEFLGV